MNNRSSDSIETIRCSDKNDEYWRQNHNLYQQLGVEPRELFCVERYETTDAQGRSEKGYLYNYQRNIGPVTTRIRARLDEHGKLLDAIQSK